MRPCARDRDQLRHPGEGLFGQQGERPKGSLVGIPLGVALPGQHPTSGLAFGRTFLLAWVFHRFGHLILLLISGLSADDQVDALVDEPEAQDQRPRR
jgi:hypothetical protein